MKLGKTGWLLFAMGSLGLNFKVQAQSSPYSPQVTGTSNSVPVSPYAMPKQGYTSAPVSSYALPAQTPAGVPVQSVSPYQVQIKTAASSETVRPPSLRRATLLANPSPSLTPVPQASQTVVPPVTPTAPKNVTNAEATKKAAAVVPASVATPTPIPVAAPAPGPVAKVVETPASRLAVTAPAEPVAAAPAPVAAPKPLPVPPPLRPLMQTVADHSPVVEDPSPAIERVMQARERQYSKARLTNADDYARMVQIRVMLAFLADPVTGRYPLKARASEAVVEVSGIVPNQHIRAHALNIAERVSKMTVTDALRVQASAVPPVPVKPADQLQRDVEATLAQGHARYVQDLKVQAHPTGLVSVYGIVPSLEHQLAVSQCVRNVSGCTSVDNQMRVRSFRYDGKAYTLVSADGRYLVAGVPPAAPARIESVEIVQTPTQPGGDGIGKSAFHSAPLVQQDPEMPTMVSAIRDAIKKRKGIIEEMPATSDHQPTAVAAATSATVDKAAAITKTANTATPQPAKPASEETQQAATKTAVPMTTGEYFEKVRVQSAPAVTPSQQPYPFGAAATSMPAKDVKGVTLVSTSQSTTSKSSDPAKKENKSNLVPVAKPSNTYTTIAPKSAEKIPTYARKTPLQPTVVMQEKLPMPARSGAASGVIVFDSDDETPQSGSRNATASLQSWLKERIARTCGKDGRDLEVVLRSPTHMAVDVKARDAATAQQLSRKILAMQELEPYRVSLKIQVAQ